MILTECVSLMKIRAKELWESSPFTSLKADAAIESYMATETKHSIDLVPLLSRQKDLKANLKSSATR